MNKIMNQPERFVDESLKGIILAHGGMLKFAENNPRSVVRGDAPTQGKVAIVTGGGYGHLPVFLGYVGKGFCDGVAVGNVFTSPSCDAIVDAAKAVNGGAGVLFLFGNYMGDSMNFDMAAEMLEMEDIPTAIVKASDDIASASREDFKNRRGVGGIFFPYKLAGAKAERMANLEEVRALAEEVCANVATLGFSMSSCQLPGAPKHIFEISAALTAHAVKLHAFYPGNTQRSTVSHDYSPGGYDADVIRTFRRQGSFYGYHRIRSAACADTDTAIGHDTGICIECKRIAVASTDIESLFNCQITRCRITRS